MIQKIEIILMLQIMAVINILLLLNNILMIKNPIQSALLVAKNPQNIRNILILPHLSHRQPSMFDVIQSKYGVYDEQIVDHDSKKTNQKIASLLSFKPSNQVHQLVPNLHNQYIINLINSPPISKLDAGISAEIRLADSILIIIDFLNGLSSQAEKALTTGLQQNIAPIFFIDNFDQALKIDHITLQSVFAGLRRLIQRISNIIQKYSKHSLQDFMFMDKLILGSVKKNWCFILSNDSIQILKKQFGLKDQESKQILNQLFEKNTTKLSTKSENKFVSQILWPLKKLINQNNHSNQRSLLQSFGFQIPTSNTSEQEILPLWLPLAQNILVFITLQTKSARQSQKHRCRKLIKQQTNPKINDMINQCDSKMPVLVSCSKVIKVNNLYLTVGRILTGTLRVENTCVSILSDNFEKGNKSGYKTQTIEQICIFTSKKGLYSVSEAVCGSIVGISNLHQFFNTNITICDHQIQPTALRQIYRPLNHLIQISVSPVQPTDLPKLIAGLNELKKLNPTLLCPFEQTGVNVVGSVSQAHLQACIDELQKNNPQIQLKKTQLYPFYRESVLGKSQNYSMTKGPNKFNRLYGSSEKLSDSFVLDIESGIFYSKSLIDKEEMYKKLSIGSQIDLAVSDQIWCFGPENCGPNILVNCTKSVQGLKQIKDSMITTFQYHTQRGGICEQIVRGVRYNFFDATLHPDAIHRGPGQIIPASRRLYTALQIRASPCLLEPSVMSKITTPQKLIGQVYSLLCKKRGSVMDQNIEPLSKAIIVVCQVPATQSFDIVSQIYLVSNGMATIEILSGCQWSNVGNPYDGERAFQLAVEIRKRKGLALILPDIKNFEDKL